MRFSSLLGFEVHPLRSPLCEQRAKLAKAKTPDNSHLVVRYLFKPPQTYLTDVGEMLHHLADRLRLEGAAEY